MADGFTLAVDFIRYQNYEQDESLYMTKPLNTSNEIDVNM